MNIIPFFVYGTLRPDFYPQSKWLKGAVSIKKAYIYGELHHNKYACAIPNNISKKTIVGYLVHFPSNIYSSKLKKADWNEQHPHHYTRELVTVYSNEGNSYQAWMYKCMYTYNNPVHNGDWVDYINKIDNSRNLLTLSLSAIAIITIISYYY